MAAAGVGCRREWKLVSDSLALLLLRIGPPPSSKRFFLSRMHLPGFKRFWHVLFEVGVSAFTPFGSLTAASGLARTRLTCMALPTIWRTLGLSAFWPKTSDRYRVLCVIFPVCHRQKSAFPSFPSFVFPSHEQTLVLVLFLSHPNTTLILAITTR